MSAGARSHPPDLPNFEYRDWLGGGGFADVFLYDQIRPSRKVAVKVLRAGSLDDEGFRAFDAEANLMAKVSAHPYIVSIFGADVAADGRPFLVMEYYARPHFGLRAKGGGLPVQEVLRVGVRVASAVETAHRAGIHHRDIKPANILVNEYDRPGLTDFGIAGERGAAASGAEGMTVAFSPPEVLKHGELGSEVGDVYSLAATLYALLAARAPFEISRGDNSGQAVLHRTLNTPIPPIGRAEVPRSLELLLQQAMSRDPSHRPQSAATFARALQGVEREMDLAITEFELAGADEVPARPRDESDPDSTRAGRIQVVHPTQEPVSHIEISGVPRDLTERRGAVEPPVATPSSVPPEPPTSDTVARAKSTVEPPAGPAVLEQPGSDTRTSAGPRLGLAAAAGVAVMLLVGLVVAAALRSDGEASAASTSTVDEDAFVAPRVPSAPQNLEVVLAGTDVTISWTAPDAEPGDWYTVTRLDLNPPAVVADDVTSLEWTLAGVNPADELCFTVTANRSGVGTLGASNQRCAE